MSCARLLLVLAMAGSLPSLAKHPPRQVDLAKLRDPSTANAEALRLLAAREGAEKHHYIIRAKLWCALVVNRPTRFYHPYRTSLNDEALKARAGHAIRLLPPDERRASIDSMRRLATKERPLPEALDRWLQSLASKEAD